MVKIKELPKDAGYNWELSSLNPKNKKTPFVLLPTPPLSPLETLALSIQNNLLEKGWTFINALTCIELPDIIGLVYKHPSRRQLRERIDKPSFIRQSTHFLQFGAQGEHGQLGRELQDEIDRYLNGTNLNLTSPPQTDFGKVHCIIPNKFLGLEFGQKEAILLHPGIARLTLPLETYAETLEILTAHQHFCRSGQVSKVVQDLKARYTDNPVPLFSTPHQLNKKARLPIDAFNSSSF